jgi:membrane-bound metal-dependent hydrolase YbcI (DUF457 family)
VTTVGHSLTGLSIAVLTLPRGKSLGWYLLVGQFYLFFTNLPDFPIPGWGHNNYHVSHSIFVTLLLASLFCLFLLWPTIREQVRARVFLAWSLTWLSHMPLDSLYNWRCLFHGSRRSACRLSQRATCACSVSRPSSTGSSSSHASSYAVIG